MGTEEGVSLAYVVTTVQAPTRALAQLAEAASLRGQSLFVIGDLGSPRDWELEGCEYLDVEAQEKLPFRTSRALPHGSYSRKLLGYLLAAQTGAEWLRETDDDNFPYPPFFESPGGFDATVIGTGQQWFNYMTAFTDKQLWPRGFPLSEVLKHEPGREREIRFDSCPPMVLQSLADGDPDLDAICRLLIPGATDTQFKTRRPLVVDAGTWTPFNSQSTTWHRDLLALMYLPSTCSMRLTDIWRSFVALRLLHAANIPLVVTSPIVRQVRNAHDWRIDFEAEIGGFLGSERFVEVLLSVDILGGLENVQKDMQMLYRALIGAGFLQAKELVLLNEWLSDVSLVLSLV